MANIITSRGGKCKKLGKWFFKIKRSINESILGRKIIQMEEFLKDEMKIMADFHSFSDVMKCACCHQEIKDINNDFTDISFKACKLEEEFKSLFYSQFLTDKQACRLAIGPFIQEIYKNLELNDFKLMAYFSHDSNLSQFGYALKTGRYEWPPYAANIIIERYSSINSSAMISFNNSYTLPSHSPSTSPPSPSVTGKYVRIIYNGELLSLPWYNNPQNPTLCPWDNFKEFIKELLPLKDKDECRE